MTKNTEDHSKKTWTERHGLVWKLMIAGLVGAATIVGLKTGWSKLVGLAKGVKPQYNLKEQDVLYGAFIGTLSGALVNDKEANREKDSLIEGNSYLQDELVRLKTKKSFAEQVAKEKSESLALQSHSLPQ